MRKGAHPTDRPQRTSVVRVSDWEEFERVVKTLEDLTRKVWDEVWFRGQANAEWPLHTTLERRSPNIRSVSKYLNLIGEIKPAIEIFTGAVFSMPKPNEIVEMCYEYDRFEFQLRSCAVYLAHLRHCGFPSPMLDWSHSPYVAAYFAFAHAKHDGDVAIYAYRERPVNFKIGDSDLPQIITFGPNVRTHKRHFRQQSRYTACARYVDGAWLFESHESVFGLSNNLDQDRLWKVIIPAKERMKVLSDLDKFNLNDFTLFDSEESLLEMLAMRVIDMREGRP
ncbi:FRG domain-containing protein [Bradyrhizobium erythrophlei]|uniref:FRG domain-containing protein n=1 Tax=Bradyrhizobium erythrophlei TaxID=1437360 RepID=A0A1M5GRU3_9BRAD|nr:FRG domain-containing protein [Bradyrhizobium erythrophlei]